MVTIKIPQEVLGFTFGYWVIYTIMRLKNKIDYSSFEPMIVLYIMFVAMFFMIYYLLKPIHYKKKK